MSAAKRRMPSASFPVAQAASFISHRKIFSSRLIFSQSHYLAVSTDITQAFGKEGLGDDFMGDFTVHISQAEVASAVPKGQFFVVDSHQVQQRRVEIVDVHFLLGSVPAEVVGGSVSESRADTGPSEAE